MTASTHNYSHSKRIAILIDGGFEDSEFLVPRTALNRTDAVLTVLGSRMNEEYKGKRGKVSVQPDATTAEVRSEDFDAIYIPGGHAPDRMRRNDQAVRLVMNAMAQEKMVASICHGPQMLIEADQLQGRRATGFRSIRKDIQNAGATYLNDPVVVDGNLITARRPGDLPLFTVTLLGMLGLVVTGEALPAPNELEDEWWQLGAQWGGSSRQEILNVLNTALVGERYTLSGFRQYLEKIDNTEAKLVFGQVISAKEIHVEQLEIRMRQLGETVSWQAVGSEALATLQSWLQSNDESEILRRGLGDLQTGAIDADRFSGQLTDPKTCELLDQITTNLTELEGRVGDLYRARFGSHAEPPMPTTVSAG